MTFARAVTYVLDQEGGLVDNPQDPGGLTSYGISQKAYPDEDIRAMTPQRAAQIYERDYWTPLRGEQLPDPVSFALLDFAVNSGVHGAIRTLQKALEIQADGIMGPYTLGVATRTPSKVVIINLSTQRILLLAEDKNWQTFKEGWTKRVISTALEALS